ncbi:MAG: RraA family protein [Candidatus Acidiferrales bacterium]|jgi:4-hydroxy-4-methyl-2-oxoglutarate aldolase
MTAAPLAPAQLEQLRSLSTCVVASAIETFGVRLRNKGFTDSGIRCVFQDHPTVVGYAATARLRSSDPPMEGKSYYDRADWWQSILKIPPPRIVVIQDVDPQPGLGALLGEVHANVLRALGCVAAVTNGSVRDLHEVERSGIQVFARGVAVSHAYAHIFDFGGTVEVAGLSVSPGDLLQGDIHGVQTIPREIAARVPERALEIVENRREFVAVTRSQPFSIEEFSRKTKEFHS